MLRLLQRPCPSLWTNLSREAKINFCYLESSYSRNPLPNPHLAWPWKSRGSRGWSGPIGYFQIERTIASNCLSSHCTPRIVNDKSHTVILLVCKCHGTRVVRWVYILLLTCYQLGKYFSMSRRVVTGFMPASFQDGQLCLGAEPGQWSAVSLDFYSCWHVVQSNLTRRESTTNNSVHTGGHKAWRLSVTIPFHHYIQHNAKLQASSLLRKYSLSLFYLFPFTPLSLRSGCW